MKTIKYFCQVIMISTKFIFACLVYQAMGWYFSTSPLELPVFTGGPGSPKVTEHSTKVNGFDYSIMDLDKIIHGNNGSEDWNLELEIYVSQALEVLMHLIKILNIDPMLWLLRFRSLPIYNHKNGNVHPTTRVLKPVLVFNYGITYCNAINDK